MPDSRLIEMAEITMSRRGSPEVVSEEECPVCHSNSYSRDCEGIFDTRFGISGDFSIFHCNGCGLQRTFPVFSDSELKTYYERHYNFGGESDTLYTRIRGLFLLSWFYRIWLTIDSDVSFHSRKGKGKLLDVGCNEGRGLAIYRNNGFDAEGVEINSAAAQKARGNGFVVHSTFPGNPSSRPDSREKGLYDIVVLSNVLEHSTNPEKFLAEISAILKPGGELWISCPNSRSWLRSMFGKYWINWHVPFHIFHFSSKSITRLLKNNGFEVRKIVNQTPSLWISHSFISRFFARRGFPTRMLRNPFLIIPLLISFRLFQFPLLFFGNIMGMGDCLVVTAVKQTK